MSRPRHRRARTTTSGSRDGETVGPTPPARKLGTRAPGPARVRGLDDPDLPGLVAGLRAGDRAARPRRCRRRSSIPAGYCQNVLATGRAWISGTEVVRGREAIVVECDHPRTIEIAADRPDFRIWIAVDRADGVILRLEESIGGDVTRDAGRHLVRAGRNRSHRRLRLRLPDRDDDALLSDRPGGRAPSDPIAPDAEPTKARSHRRAAEDVGRRRAGPGRQIDEPAGGRVVGFWERRQA